MSEAQNIHPEIKHAIVEFSEIYKRLLALENDPEYRKFVDTPRKIVTTDDVIAHAKKKRDYLNEPVTTGFFMWKKTVMREGAPFSLMALTFNKTPVTKNVLATVHHDE